MIDELKSMTIPLILILCLITAPLQAQFIIKQSEYTVPLSYSLVPEDAPIESEEDEMIFFMAIPADKLRQAALEEGNEVVISEQILYSDGENYAVEYSSEDGKITVVANPKDGIMLISSGPRNGFWY